MSDPDSRTAGDPGNGGAEFVEQARWLLEWHNRRGEAITIRATAVLGFVGVVLALLLQGASVENFQPEWWTWVALTAALLCLLASGICALLVILPTETQMPSVEQLRMWWSQQMADYTRDQSAAQIAESFLIGKELDKDSPVSDALTGADRRAWWFKRSAVALLSALVPLATMTFDVLVRVGR